MIFDSTKNLKYFYNDYEKDPTLLNDLAPKGKDLDVQFPYNVIDEAKKKFHTSKYNKSGRGGDYDGGQRGGVKLINLARWSSLFASQ